MVQKHLFQFLWQKTFYLLLEFANLLFSFDKDRFFLLYLHKIADFFIWKNKYWQINDCNYFCIFENLFLFGWKNLVFLINYPKRRTSYICPPFFGKVKKTKSSPSLARWWATLTSREYLIEHFAKVHYYQQKLNEPESRGGFFRLQGNPNSSFHSGDFGENSWLIQYHLFGKYVIFFKQFDEEKVFGKFKVIQEVGIKTQPDIQIVSEWFENLHNLKRSFR